MLGGLTLIVVLSPWGVGLCVYTPIDCAFLLLHTYPPMVEENNVNESQIAANDAATMPASMPMCGMAERAAETGVFDPVVA